MCCLDHQCPAGEQLVALEGDGIVPDLNKVTGEQQAATCRGNVHTPWGYLMQFGILCSVFLVNVYEQVPWRDAFNAALKVFSV